ncbi:MAG TPA: FAD-linked oxidase C-terminal domain-containing protein [Ktedonobacteraceae bacterium]|nr:FAD-linked oxidase C-terminal domain-containing protein [Ktedonobacteraceae bacterium]
MFTEKAKEALRALFPRGQVFTDEAALVAYELDAGLDRGSPQAVVLPCSVEDVVRLVRWAAEYEVPLVARGAGTGLSGGAVADRGGVIVAFSHMNHILDVDTYGRYAVAEPCVINLRLDERAREYGLYFPPDPASQRASSIGGNVAENSGGPHCFKYGVTTNYVIGMDVVLADGRNVRIGGRALDYPAYDLCGLLTGSEGMLALMTAITVRLVRNPPAVKTMLAIFDSIEQAGVAVSAVIAAGLVPATMEMMDQKIIRIVEPFAHAGLPIEAGAALIIEVDGYPESLDAQVSEIADIMRVNKALGLRIASSEEERNAIWLARKSAAGAITRLTPSYYTVDVTVPRSRLAETLGEINMLLDRYHLQAGHVFHAGDGNLHPLILVADSKDPGLMERVHHASWEMVEMVVHKDGSVSGEHGIGIEKREYMPLMFNDAELSAMLDVKQVFDPLNLLNPGKIFPSVMANGSGTTAGIVHLPAQTGDIPQQVFTPASTQEAAGGLCALAAAGKSVHITGAEVTAMVETESGKRKVDTILSTAQLRGIKTYAPDDLYVTVGAGTPFSELQAFLASDHKQVPLVSPWPQATIGGLVAANINAPLRMRYNSLRDLVLCANIVLGDGRVIRAGRPVIKNVAGFDLTKIFAGSHGTLGLLSDLTLKIAVPPRARRTLLFPVDDQRHGLLWARRMLPQALVSSAIVLLRGTPSSLSHLVGPTFSELVQGGGLLAYTAEGLPEDVQAELAAVRRSLRETGAPEPLEVEAPTGSDLWASLLGSASGDALLLRIGLPASALPAYAQDQASLLSRGTFLADIGNGLLYASATFDSPEEARAWLNSLRQPALAAEGYAAVLSMPVEYESEIERWGYQPQTLDIMQKLKARWDPQGILNPGGFLSK